MTESQNLPASQMKTVLSIAGSDPSGGAGIQADLKTFHHFGVYGMAVISLITVQNTQGIQEVLVIHPDKIKAQILAVLEDIHPDAIKLGALGHGPAVAAIADALKEYQGPIISDPVMLSKNGAPLLVKEALQIYRDKILPISFLTTPNLDEAAVLSGISVKSLGDMKAAAEKIYALGPKNVLVKGGHLEGEEVIDILFDGKNFEAFNGERIFSKNTHGVGCTLASAIASEIAKGTVIYQAIDSAKQFVAQAIQKAPHLGKGNGPINHFASEV